MKFALAILLFASALGGCAGRDAMPTQIAQPQDQFSNCQMISAEIEINNRKVEQLSAEKGYKVAQNVVAGVAGLVVWPLFFAMDFKDAAGADMIALQQRQEYLAALAAQRCRRT